MKISHDYNEVERYDILEVISAKYLNDYRIKILFNDGNNVEIDFKAFLERSFHPSIAKYLDQNLFSNFEIRNGNLNWNDYELIFPLEDLHEGRIA